MRWIWLAVTAVAVTLLAVAGFRVLPTKLIYNPSNSAPIGFYWIDRKPVKRGDFALVHVPKRVEKMVRERGYPAANVPLLKRIFAVGGDNVCRLNMSILANGQTVATARKRDRLGRRLPTWKGCRRLRESEVFLLQEHPDSFDGRYFGQVDRALIVGRARRLRFTPWKKEED